MDIGYITEYISPIALVICLVVGFIIKNAVNNQTVNRFIPIIVAVLGVLICAWDAMAFTPMVLAAGLISGLASTGLYEACKNLLGFTDNTSDVTSNIKISSRDLAEQIESDKEKQAEETEKEVENDAN